jgi:hypothetical protein
LLQEQRTHVFCPTKQIVRRQVTPPFLGFQTPVLVLWNATVFFAIRVIC